MSLKAHTYDQTGKKLTDTTLDKDTFDVTANPHLLALAVKVYQSNQRQATRRVKTRGEVNYSTRKLWRQKGTGRARHGARRAPIFVGGGSAHGPTGNESFTQKLTKKMRRRAILASLSTKQLSSAVSVLSNSEKVATKTKDVLKLTQKIAPKQKKVLLVLHTPLTSIINATKNLPHISVTQATRLNTFEILNNDHLIVSKEALKLLPKIKA